VARGWQVTLADDVMDALDLLGALPLAGFLITAVHREGRMHGPDLDLMAEAAARTRLPICASGGIATSDDLHALAARGVSSAVLGMALYTGALDAAAVAKEFRS